MTTINIIGAGRVGRTFLRLFGTRIRDVASTTLASAENAVSDAGFGRAAVPSDMAPADVWFLTVPDTQIWPVSEKLALTTIQPAIAIHCSGYHTAEAMAPLRAKGWSLASVHPNLSFADPDTAAAGFAGTPCGIEGDTPALDPAETLFKSIGASTFQIASDQKALYHAAAVFSNNFATVLQAIAREAWAEAGVPDDVAERLNTSLLDATEQNVSRLGPVAALTGPAARGDTAVVTAQGATVTQWNEDAGELYRRLSEMAARLKSTGAV